MREVIRGGWVVGFAHGAHTLVREGVVVWEGDSIVHVGSDFSGTVDQEIDARDKLVCPGFIDTHVALTVMVVPAIVPPVRRVLGTVGEETGT
jgi:5-methylthioadenosine/S-adenosylhomocysteine deaminase